MGTVIYTAGTGMFFPSTGKQTLHRKVLAGRNTNKYFFFLILIMSLVTGGVETKLGPTDEQDQLEQILPNSRSEEKENKTLH